MEDSVMSAVGSHICHWDGGRHEVGWELTRLYYCPKLQQQWHTQQWAQMRPLDRAQRLAPQCDLSLSPSSAGLGGEQALCLRGLREQHCNWSADSLDPGSLRGGRHLKWGQLLPTLCRAKAREVDQSPRAWTESKAASEGRLSAILQAT